MKKNVSRLLTAVVSAAMLTGMMPSVICADDIDGAADSVAADVVSSGEDTAAAAQEVTASVSLTDLITVQNDILKENGVAFMSVHRAAPRLF